MNEFQDEVTDLVDERIEAGDDATELCVALLLVAGQLLADFQGGVQGQMSFLQAANEVAEYVPQMGEEVTIH